MKHYYSFTTHEVCESGNFPIDILCVCYGGLNLDATKFLDDLEAVIKRSSVLPDSVLVFGSKEQAASAREAWNTLKTHRDNLLQRGQKNKISYIKDYRFYSWDRNKFKIDNLSQLETDYKISPEKILRKGVLDLVHLNKVVHIAPSGHSFKHPSGNENKVFIQARELATSESELKFVALALASMFTRELYNARTILIDTMGIYSYVREALILTGGQAEIRSFHSYDDLKKLNPPGTEYFCVISASTSGNMARELLKQNFDADRILTLVDISNKNRPGSTLASLDKTANFEQLLSDKAGTLIEIIGENFTSKSKPPRPVTIGLPHTPPGLKDILDIFAIDGVFPLNERVDQKSKLLSLNASKLIENDSFKVWLDSEAKWCLPISINVIIHTNDPGSAKLAEEASNLLRAQFLSSRTIAIVCSDRLYTLAPAEINGILVVTAICGDGGSLREISRDLREIVKAEIPRHFIAAVGLCQSAESWTRLKDFLTRNPTDRKYGFSNWLCLPIGNDGEDTVWNKLSAIAQKAAQIDIDHPKLDCTKTRAALDCAVEVITGSRNGFLPKPNGLPLRLSDGFLFFQSDDLSERYDQVPQSTVFLTIASVLQYAREHKEAVHQLRPSGYESVVLAPECFLRFNDNLLQACFLRASLPSELDYSVSPSLSTLMTEFLLKVFERSSHKYGDASLEFAAIMAIGHLRLGHENMKKLISETIEKKVEEEPDALLGLLLLTALTNEIIWSKS